MLERHEDPTRFIEAKKDPRAMTIKELREQITYKQEAGQIYRKERVKLYHKTAYPFAAVVVVMLGAPIAIRFGRAGFFAGLVIAFFISFIYWALSFATLEGLSESGKLHPFLACLGSEYSLRNCREYHDLAHAEIEQRTYWQNRKHGLLKNWQLLLQNPQFYPDPLHLRATLFRVSHVVYCSHWCVIYRYR